MRSHIPTLGFSCNRRVRAVSRSLWHGGGGSGASAPRRGRDTASLSVAAGLPRNRSEPSQLSAGYVRHNRKSCAARLAALSGQVLAIWRVADLESMHLVHTYGAPTGYFNRPRPNSPASLEASPLARSG